MWTLLKIHKIRNISFALVPLNLLNNKSRFTRSHWKSKLISDCYVNFISGIENDHYMQLLT